MVRLDLLVLGGRIPRNYSHCFHLIKDSCYQHDVTDHVNFDHVAKTVFPWLLKSPFISLSIFYFFEANF